MSAPQKFDTHWFDAMVANAALSPITVPVTIAPDLAAYILTKNPDNRNMRATKVTHMVRDIVSNRWAFNGETIIIAKDGTLNDGQHRLVACVEAGIPIESLMVFGIPRNTRMTVDQGGQRGAGDFLSMEGIDNAKLMASIARSVISYELENEKNFNTKSSISAQEILERIHEDPFIAQSARFVTYHQKTCRAFITGSSIGFVHYVLRRYGEKGTDYLVQVAKGEDLKVGDAAYAVRQRLLSMGKTTQQGKVEILLRGWVAFRDGRRLSIAKTIGEFPAI